MKEYEKVTIESARELRDWLEENHQTRGTTWLVRWKKASGKP